MEEHIWDLKVVFLLFLQEKYLNSVLPPTTLILQKHVYLTTRPLLSYYLLIITSFKVHCNQTLQ